MSAVWLTGGRTLDRARPRGRGGVRGGRLSLDKRTRRHQPDPDVFACRMPGVAIRPLQDREEELSDLLLGRPAFWSNRDMAA